MAFLAAAKLFPGPKNDGRRSIGVAFTDLNRHVLELGEHGAYPFGPLWPRVANEESHALRKLCQRLKKEGRFPQ